MAEGSVPGEAVVMDGRLRVLGDLGLLMAMGILFGSGNGEGDSSRSESARKAAAKIPDHRGPVRLPGMVWFIIAFLPWIILWAGEPLLGFFTSRLAAAGAAFLLSL